jgi:tellurite methyltransferase
LSAWEEAYRSVKSLWGLKPDHVLIDYGSLVPKGNVLDLGMGEGRNSFFFAKMGYKVEGFDISQTAIERCIKMAKNENLKVKAEAKDLREVDIPKGRYSLIIAAWVLNFFKKPEAEEIIRKIKEDLKRNGLVYITIFSLDDPGYEKAKNRLELVGEKTFYSSRRGYFIHYFKEEEFLSLFSDLKTVYHAKGTGLDLEHGEPHYHGFIEYMDRNSGIK